MVRLSPAGLGVAENEEREKREKREILAQRGKGEKERSVPCNRYHLQVGLGEAGGDLCWMFRVWLPRKSAPRGSVVYVHVNTAQKQRGLYLCLKRLLRGVSCGGTQGGHTLPSPSAGLHTPVSLHAVDVHSHIRSLEHARRNAHMCVLALFSLSLLLWCQTLKGKNFYYLKGPPVQCLFFFPLLFLMCFGKVPVSFTPSLYVPQVRKQTRRGVQQPKEALWCQATPLLLCRCPSSAGMSCRFEGKKEKELICVLGLAIGGGTGG